MKAADMRSNVSEGLPSLLTPTERRQILNDFNNTSVPFPDAAPIHEVFEAQVAKTPDAVAVICGENRLTYAQLNRRANQIAHALIACGVRPDQLVCVYAERSLDTVVGLLGVLKAGGAYVPLDPTYPIERLRFILTDSDPVAILAHSSAAEAVSGFGKPVVMLDQQSAQSDVNPEDKGLLSRQLAYVIYTSGSTGQPKGVMVEHRSVLRLVCNSSYARIGSDDCVAHCASPAFDATTWEIWSALLNGARLLVVPPSAVLDPSVLNETLTAHGVTAMWLTVGLFNEYVDALEQTFRGLNYLLIGGDALNPTTVARALARPVPPGHLLNGYGPTETTTFATTYPITAISERAVSVPIGRPIGNTRIYILNSNREPVPVGMVGEIYIGGPGVARGYLNHPSLTAARFIADPFSDGPDGRLYSTGDRGRWRQDGNIEFLGRDDFQVKIRGFRVELGEVEAVAQSCPGVKETVVVARQDELGDRRLIGYVAADLPKLKALRRNDPHKSAEMVQQWKTLYEETYSGTRGPSFIGWNSSYTGEPIPQQEMQEWLHQTVERIRELRPRKVLEIGCGVGLLLEHLAPQCEVYLGTDFSAEALESLRTWLLPRAELGHVQLEQASALELEGLPTGAFDTVILNSVAQYFPDAHYLLTVLERASRIVRPGGRIFVGDVRHHGLLKIFHSSVQLEKAGTEVSTGHLRNRIVRALEQEKELVVDPGLFAHLPHHLPDIGAVRIMLKRGRSENELTRYRYDVVLEKGEAAGRPETNEVVWGSIGTAADLMARMSGLRGQSLLVRGVPNRRVHHDLAATRLIERSENSRTAGRLKDALSHELTLGEDPEQFWKAGEDQGYEARISWSLDSKEGNFDAEFRSLHHADSHAAAATPQHGSAPAGYPHLYANDPWGKGLQQELISQLREYLKERLPAFMNPSAFVLLDSLPLTANGKVDRHALPAPVLGSLSSAEYDAPQGETETALAEIWQEILQVERVGRRDNFFELGGHSMIAMKLIVRVAARFGIRFHVQEVFKHSTFRRMAQSIDERRMEIRPPATPNQAEFEEGVI